MRFPYPYLLAGLVAASALGACEKEDLGGDFGGNGLLRGRLLVVDSLAGPGQPQPVAGRQVRLGDDPADRLNFLYSTTTDKDGYFLFEHLRPGHAYGLFFSDTVRRVRYSGKLEKTPGDTPVQLLATNDQLDQHGLFVQLLSGRTPGAAPLGGVTLCGFSSRLPARADTCLNRLFELKTDNLGRAVRYDLSPGRYYLLGTTALAGQPYRLFDSVDVPARGIGRRLLYLEPRARTGFTLTVLDQRGTPLPNLDVCVFASAVLARVDTCAGSIAQPRTNAAGQTSVVGLTPRRYYLRLRGQYGRLRLRGYDSVDVVAGQVRPKQAMAR